MGGLAMNDDRKDNVRSLFEEKYTALSEQYGWPLAFSEGYVNGEADRWRGTSLSSYVMAGIDQYALGFRAGYFGRAKEPRDAGRSNRDRGNMNNRENESSVTG